MIILRNLASLLIFSIVSALPDQLHILWQLHLKELLGLLISLGLLKLWYSTCGMLGLVSGCILYFLRAINIFEEFCTTNFCKKTLIDDGVPQGSVLEPTLFLQYINNLTDDAISNIAVYADDTVIYSKCDQVTNLWLQQELASGHSRFGEEVYYWFHCCKN